MVVVLIPYCEAVLLTRLRFTQYHFEIYGFDWFTNNAISPRFAIKIEVRGLFGVADAVVA